MSISPIALDATYSLGRNLSGVGVYSREILRGLAGAHPEQRFKWCYRPHRFLRSLRESVPGNCSRRILLENRAPACGIFHGLNQRMPAGRARRSAVTFHDLFVLTGDYSTAEFRARFAQQAREAAQRADLIIAVSKFTASQVEALLKVEPARLRVVGHGAHPVESPAPAVRNREKIILHVGVIQKRKNIAKLVEAFERLPGDWRLVLAGGQGYGSEEATARIAASAAAARIDVLGFVSDEELDRLYRRASIFAFPSLDEGFGIPLLEAMAYEIPILTSNGSALREVAEGVAWLVDPNSVDEITHGLLMLTADSYIRENLAAKGKERAAMNTWRAAAEQTWRIYCELGA